MEFNYARHFALSAARYPHRAAVSVGKTTLTYEQLKTRVQLLSAQLQPVLGEGRVGVLASRSIDTCTAFLGTAWAGGTYVPLGLSLPDERLIALFEQLELDALIVDEAGAKKLSPAVRAAAPELILGPGNDVGRFQPVKGRVEAAVIEAQPADVAPDHLAYIIFTSGTTGMPKGVMVNGRSITLYLDAIEPHYRLMPEDRAAETCESNFDLSIHNMLTCWRGGASLHIMRPLDLVAPARFIRSKAITTWLSVPSVITLMRQAGGLKPDTLPTLRLTWFCGEPLPLEAAQAWAAAAPNSVIDNFYGPTEITIAVVLQRFGGEGPVTPERGIVAIGQPISGISMKIVDQNGDEVPDETPGEIVLAGAQCASGYFRKPDLTAKVFKTVDGEPGYFTGDRAYRDRNGIFHHLGRMDNQIKFKGHRIELEEIDAKIREVTGTSMVGTVTWPMEGETVKGLAGFYSVPELDTEKVRERLRALLPPHMVPGLIENIADMPLSANGKVDRKALRVMLDNRNEERDAAA
ncbi:MAG: AMP-binding protein [Pseudomonadota bacterium]